MYHSSMAFFHVFKIVQMVPNRAKHYRQVIFSDILAITIISRNLSIMTVIFTYSENTN